MTDEKIINIRISDHEEPGLYLIFEDLTKLALTRENINRITEEYWMDPNKISPDLKTSADLKRCKLCPSKEKDDFCDALRPILPLLNVIDEYKSFDKVTAIYKGDDIGLCHIMNTTMQRALRYISNLSLMEYCRLGKKFHKYYHGIIPIAGTEEIVNRMYLNIYYIHRGNEQAIEEIISQLKQEMTIAIKNQLKRLRLISKNDAFLNAFVLTHLVADVLHDNKDTALREQFKKSLK